MKHLLGYVIWNKVAMIEWLLDGIKESFTPEQVDLLFVLDNPTDGSDVLLLELLERDFMGWNHRTHIMKQEQYKFTCQNFLMKQCLMGNYKSLIAPQDDQYLIDRQLIDSLDGLFFEYGERLGVVGLRDGFDFGYHNMISSLWSESTLTTVPRLKPGEYRGCSIVNDGPLIYPAHLIKRIGFNDVQSYKRFYIEDDYCMHAKAAGFQNIVMGSNLIHDKKKASIGSTHYDDNRIGANDLKTFRAKWNL